MYHTVLTADNLPWSPLDFPGVSMRVIYHNPQTGGMTIQTKMEPGSTIPAHFHTQADEMVWVLSGDFIEAGMPHAAGTIFIGAAGIPHGPHSTRGGCIVLTTFSAPLDFELVQG